MPLRGETIGTAFVRLLVDGDELPENVRRELRKATPEMEQVGEEHSRAYNEGFSAQQKKDRNVEKSLTANIQRAFAKIDADAQFFSKGFGDRLSKNLSREIERSFPQMSKSSERLGKKISDSILKDFARTGNFNLDLRKRLLSAVEDAESDNRWDKFSRKIDLVGDHFGRAFGKGSRNNFLNWVGTVMGGLVDLGQILPQTFKKVSEVTTLFKEGFNAGGGGFKGLIAGGTEASSAFAGLAKSLPALAVGAVIAAGALGALTAIASGAIAALTALASSITAALIGAIGVLLPLLPVAAIGIGTLALAMGGLSKQARKALSESLKPLSNELKELRKSAASGLFGQVTEQAKLLTPVVRELRPLFHNTGKAIADVGTSFAKSMNSKGFRDFVANMDKFVPKVIRSLGRTTRSVFAGLGGLFVTLEPFTLDFLHAVEGIATNFAKWTNSKKGRDEIATFFHNAVHSAHDLLDLAGAVGGVLGTLLTGGGEKSGDNIIESLTRNVQQFNDFLKRNPDAIQSWFKNGEAIARDIGDIVVSVGHLVGVLDDPNNRKLAHAFFDVIKAAITALPTLVNFLTHPLRVTIDLFKTLKGGFDDFKKAFQSGMAIVVSNFLDGVGSLIHGAALALGWIPGIGPKLKKADRDFRTWAESVRESILGIPKSFTVTGRLKMEVDAIGGAHLSNQARAKLLEIAFDRFATGGRPRPDWPAIIGENGPELWVPDRPGTILPNNDAATQQFLRNSTTTSTTMSRSSSINNSRNVGDITIITPTEDPRRVADELINRLAGAVL